MPANEHTRGPMATLTRLLRTIASWRQRRAARRRVQIRGLMHMSDRTLADIGVRRADLNAALSGMVPVEQIARTRGSSPWTAQVHALPPRARRREASATGDLGAAA